MRYFFLLLVFPLSLCARDRANGWCQDGNSTVITNGQNSTNKYQRSFPSCTVTVYLAGTTSLATIYADNSGTTKANPFTASSAGQWFFYANDGHYDVRFSGGGISVPFTVGDVVLLDTLAVSSLAVNTTLFNFPAKALGGSLTSGIPNTVNFSATLGGCPAGVAGTDSNHYLYISGGAGTAEAVLITGGTCTSGGASGTIIFTPANNHSGAWTIASATAGIQEALNVVSVAGQCTVGEVYIPGGSYNIYATIAVPDYCHVRGAGKYTTAVYGHGAITMMQPMTGKACNRCILEDFIFVGDGTTTNTIILGSTSLGGIVGITIRNVAVTGFVTGGITIRSPVSGEATGLDINASGATNGLKIQGVVGGGNEGDRFTVSKSYIYFGTETILIDGASGVILENNYIYGTTVAGTTALLHIKNGDRVIVMKNHFEPLDTAANSVLLENTNNSTIDNSTAIEIGYNWFLPSPGSGATEVLVGTVAGSAVWNVNIHDNSFNTVAGGAYNVNLVNARYPLLARNVSYATYGAMANVDISVNGCTVAINCLLHKWGGAMTFSPSGVEFGSATNLMGGNQGGFAFSDGTRKVYLVCDTVQNACYVGAISNHALNFVINNAVVGTVDTSSNLSMVGNVGGSNVIATSGAGTAAAGQIKYGGTTAAAANCGGAAAACIVVNVAGTTRYIPIY